MRLLSLIGALLLASCATRSAPAEFPPDAPSSASAPEAPILPVTRALDEDPPLPGEGKRWPGLDDVKTSTAGHHHHGGHHGH